MITEDKIGTLEDEAVKRRERLKALKQKQDSEDKTEINKTNEELPKPKFRSYNPTDETLKSSIVNKAKPGNVEDEVKDQLEAAKTTVILEEVDLTSLAPRKPDWDLKKNITKKLERLEKRTQKAIAELIRDRLQKNEFDLATSVAIGSQNIKYENQDD